MKTSVARGAALGLAFAACLIAQEALAFYPLGGYDSNGNLRLARWKLEALDHNNDGDVDRETEGIPLIFESGPLGFSDNEIALAMEGFEVWEGVTTAYIAFYYAGKTPDVLETEGGFGPGQVDGVNYVSFNFEEFGEDAAEGLGTTMHTFVLEDTTITIGGQEVPFTGGQMVEADFIFNGDAFAGLPDDNLNNMEGLRGGGVVLGGYAIGLGDSPLLNLSRPIIEDLDNDGIVDPNETEILGGLEDRVVFLPDEFGNPVARGVTPSMVGYMSFGYTDGTQSRIDLAPDDIAGVSFLYPRADQSNFFDINHEARTTARFNLPSAPLEGAHVVAWCDADNNPGTRRVPFVDTLTGLYEFETSQRGRFQLKGLFKQLPNEEGILFEPTYTLSCSPFDPPANEEQSAFDSTHGGGFFEGGGGELSFASAFSSEIFRDGGNVRGFGTAGNPLGIDNADLGTPLVFSAARNRVVAADTGKSMEQLLPGTTPMFGARNDVCPLNVTVASLVGISQGPGALRALRDGILLPTAFGTAIADAYYRVSPALAAFLLEHPVALSAARGLVVSVEWILGNRIAVLALALLAGLAYAARRRLRHAKAAGALALAAGLLALAAPAEAQLLPMTTADIVQKSDLVVTGTVTSVESHWTPDRRIVTQVVLAVDDSVKGPATKGVELRVSVPGGQVGPVVQVVSGMAKFKTGEEVLVCLKKRLHKKPGDAPYRVVAGSRGKYVITTDPETQEKQVIRRSLMAPSLPVGTPPPAVQKQLDEQDKQYQKKIPLEQFKESLRAIVREQAKKK